MFQSNPDEPPSRDSSARFGKLAFVVGEPAEARSDRDDARQTGDDEATTWLHERLTDCYND